MWTQADHERERVGAQRKAQMDHYSLMNAARREGRLLGVQMGIIQVCEQVLDRPQTSMDQLEVVPLKELTRLAEQLLAEAKQLRSVR